MEAAARRVCRRALAGGRLPPSPSRRSSSSSFPSSSSPAADSADPEDLRLASSQSVLLAEASSLTRSLYRRCLRSASLLSSANDRDESDFLERDEDQRRRLDDYDPSGDSGPISMAPPVDRANELRSRGGYYRSFARENFDGHWDLLGEHGFHIGEGGDGAGGRAAAPRPWREEQVEQFAYLIRTGEEKRRYVLGDYGFDDPCGDGWSEELEGRLGRFEEGASELTREAYGRMGWVHSSALAAGCAAARDSEDEDFDEDFDSDDEG